MEKKVRRKKEVGRWTRQEHARFIEAIIKYGKNWKMVQECVPSRSTAQVRSHAQKFFNRLTKEQRTILLPNEVEEEVPGEEQRAEGVKQEGEGVRKQELRSINDMENQDSSSSDGDQGSHMQIQEPEGPLHLLQMIKKQSNEGKDKVGVSSFIKKLNSQTENINQDIIKKKSSSSSEEIVEEIKNLQRSKNQVTNLSNLLIAYITLSESQESLDESFFLTLLRRQRKYIYRNQFFKLIDLPKKQEPKVHVESRKKSFSLIETQERLSSPQIEGTKVESDKNDDSPYHFELQKSKEHNREENLN